MFNPQRKSKMSDIFMQEKMYKIHLAKMDSIEKNSITQRSKRYDNEEQQQTYLSRLQKSKREVKERLSSDLRRQNQRLLSKLMETDSRPDANPELKDKRRHFNSYFSNKKEAARIHQENYTLVMRMDKQSPGVPSLADLKRQYKKSRKLAKNCRKLPSIMKHEEEYKRRLSQPFMDSIHMSTGNIGNRNIV